MRVPKVDVLPRYRMKGKSGSAQKFKRKHQALDIKKQQFLKNATTARDDLGLGPQKRKFNKHTGGVLDRFHAKTQG